MQILNLAACSIIKISRSHLKPHINLHTAEEAIFKTITFTRRRAVQPYDLDGRMATILNQLWFSNNAFKGKDGVEDGLQLLCRTRVVRSWHFPL